MRGIHLHFRFLAAIYGLRLKGSGALLQSGGTGTGTAPCATSKYQNTQKHECKIFEEYPPTKPESVCWAFENNIDSKHAKTHSLFREVASHLRSSTAPNGSRASCSPFLIKRDVDVTDERDVSIIEFSSDDLKFALASDYLDACTGKNRSSMRGNGVKGESSDGQGGWRMEGLGSASGKSNEHSFQSKRLDWNSVLGAQNTVVFNSAGAHISSQLAPASLAALHGLSGTATGVCLNLYMTKSDLLQSAPPHTDKQDVVVIQTQGRKRWRVYSPPDSTVKYNADPFCRGKGDDELSVPMLSDEGSELLFDVTLLPGDVLFVPSRFPHTTDTLNCYNDDEHHSNGRNNEERKSSIHLTLGLDTHVWDMNYMSMRSLALRRFGIHDVLLESNNHINDIMDSCVGKVNQLSYELREGLFSSLDTTLDGPKTAENLLAYHDRVNFECGADTYTHLTYSQCLETVIHFETIWQKIESTHNDMYTAALNEERTREVENGGWTMNVGETMAKKRAERLSIFRVPMFFEQLDKLRQDHRIWGSLHKRSTIEKTLPNLFNGDQVEAYLLDANACNLVGIRAEEKISWVSAKVIKVRPDGLFNLQLFDGKVENGVGRLHIKGPHGLGIFI